MNQFRYDDTGMNCLSCNSELEPHKYVCTVCELTHRERPILETHEQS